MTTRKSLSAALRRTAPPATAAKTNSHLPAVSATAEEPAPETARPRRTLPVALAAIRVTDRLRLALDAGKVETIARSMAEIGLQSPVLLRPWRAPGDTAGWGREDPGLYGLVAGAHRLEAARRLGWTRIEAIVVDGTPDEMRLVEIDENLARAELTALDRARFLATRKAVHARLSPGHRHGGDRKSAEYIEKNQVTKTGTRSFPADAMAQTGLSTSMIYRAVEIGEKLDGRLAEALARTPLAGREGDLHRIARMPAGEQRELAAALRACPAPPATLSALLGAGGGPAPRTAGQKSGRLGALKRAWNAAAPTDRRRFLQWVGAGDGGEAARHNGKGAKR